MRIVRLAAAVVTVPSVILSLVNVSVLPAGRETHAINVSYITFLMFMFHVPLYTSRLPTELINNQSLAVNILPHDALRANTVYSHLNL